MKQSQYLFLMIIFLTLLFSCVRPDNQSKTNLEVLLKNKGDSCLSKGDYNEAMNFYIEAIKLADKKQNSDIYASAFSNMGIICAIFNDLESASYHFNKSFNIANQINNKKISAICATNLMLLAISKKDTLELRKWQNYLQINPLEDTIYNKFWKKYSQGLLDIGRNENKIARIHLKEAEGLANKQDWDPELSSMISIDYATSFLNENNIDSAIYFYNKALVENQEYPNQKKEIYKHLIPIYRNLGIKDSLLKFQTLLIELNDSVYNQSKFHLTRYNLRSYEEEIHEANLRNANQRLVIAVTINIIILSLLFVIIILYLKLKRRDIEIINQNRKLLKENEIWKIWRKKYYEIENELKQKQITKEGKDISSETAVLKFSESEIDDNIDDNIIERKKETADIENLDSLEKSENKRLDSERVKEIMLNIMRIIDDGTTLYDPDLTINTISSILKINSKYVSWAISDTYNMNFRSFISVFRIREVCRRLQSEEFKHLTIAAVAEECGFNSINNFIQVFKKETGMTPKQFRKQIKEGEN